MQQFPGEGIPANTDFGIPDKNKGDIYMFPVLKDDIEKFLFKGMIEFVYGEKQEFSTGEGYTLNVGPTQMPKKKFKKYREQAKAWAMDRHPEKKPFIDEVIENVFNRSLYSYEKGPTFKLQPEGKRPTVITRQLSKLWFDGELQETSGNCGQASINNAFQKNITSFENVNKHPERVLWQRILSLYPDDTDEHWQNRQEAYEAQLESTRKSGPKTGLTTTIANEFLENMGYSTKFTAVEPGTEIDLTKTRAAYLTYTWNPNGTVGASGHAVAVRDGYMMDSNYEPYPFKGKLEGYIGAGIPKLHSVLQIKTRKNTLPSWTGFGGIDPVPNKYARAPTRFTQGRDKPY